MVKLFESKYFNHIVIISSFILIIFLGYLHHYLIENKDIYNSMVLVKSDSLITSDYTLYSPYYLLYDDLDVSLFGNKFNFIYSLSSSYSISVGRDIENDFEILLSDKYNSLVGKYVPLYVNGYIYYFLVVGTYSNNNPFFDNYIYTLESSLKYLSSSCNYIFIFDGYTSLNIDIDYLKEEGFMIDIPYSNTVEKMDNYNIINDFIILCIVNLGIVISIFLHQIISSE